MLNGKVKIIHSIVGLIKKALYKMSQYFPKPYRCFGRNVEVEIDLFSYATKAELRNAAGVPVDISKLSNVVNDVFKKIVYDKLVTRVNNNDTGGFVLKTKYNSDKSNLEKKIPDTSGIVKKTDYNVKTSEIESKIPSISSLATKSALTTVEIKIAG